MIHSRFGCQEQGRQDFFCPYYALISTFLSCETCVSPNATRREP